MILQSTAWLAWLAGSHFMHTPNGSNVVGLVALRFGDHGAKELGVVGLKNWRVSNFAQQLPTTRNNMQQAEQTAATCNIQQCWKLLAKNVMLRPFARGFTVNGYNQQK